MKEESPNNQVAEQQQLSPSPTSSSRENPSQTREALPSGGGTNEGNGFAAAAQADGAAAETGQGQPSSPRKRRQSHRQGYSGKRRGYKSYRNNGDSRKAGQWGGNEHVNGKGVPRSRQRPEPETFVINPDLEELQIEDYKSMSINELQDLMEELELDIQGKPRRQDLIFTLLKAYTARGHALVGEGVLEIVRDNPSYGFLRSRHNSYLAANDDIYVSPNQIGKHHLRTGDTIKGQLRPPSPDERYFALRSPLEVNFTPFEKNRQKRKIAFENLTALFPDERLLLEQGNGSTEDLSGRVIDLVAPIGKGQRGLIVSPPKAGKTLILQNIAKAIIRNNPETYVIILLIDERPEEVTDMQRSVQAAEVVASTFDEPATRHVQVSDLVIEKAKRLTEAGKDVVILLDSITRLARAYNSTAPSSGRILSGGVEANALERPKRFFGAARNIDQGASLTIIATALIDTGSKMDEVIYEEFKGTGNLELHLDRRIAEKRLYPAINIRRSGTRREEGLVDEEELQHMHIIRRILHDKDDLEAISILLERLGKSKTNKEFFTSMKVG